jgi:tetraacyldisaccharide 4'-kinase
MNKKYKILYPFAILYGFLISLRNYLYNKQILKTQAFQIPLIVVGNITVGGTGKTPHILYLAQFLKQKYKIASLSRGYKRKSKGFRIAQNNSSVNEIGDEPKLIKQTHPQITVAVEAQRVKGVQLLQQQNAGLQIILLDDAFQHRRLKAQINIVLIDFQRPLHTDFYLPYGTLRDNPAQLKRAHIVIITKVPITATDAELKNISGKLNLLPEQKLFFTQLKYSALQNVYRFTQTLEIEQINSSFELLLITGIAQTADFVKRFEQTKAKIQHLKFPDHYNFTSQDIHTIVETFHSLSSNHKLLITTEKDAMRLIEFEALQTIQNFVYAQPISIKFLENKQEEFNLLIEKKIKESLKK